uniref:Uncharacterized protein n=1 Tax=Timema cristinae TaxID=61476 RepID=A0A7R9D216_TIMCR|nr:unnamed protein product [Timema cristinae]
MHIQLSHAYSSISQYEMNMSHTLSSSAPKVSSHSGRVKLQPASQNYFELTNPQMSLRLFGYAKPVSDKEAMGTFQAVHWGSVIITEQQKGTKQNERKNDAEEMIKTKRQKEKEILWRDDEKHKRRGSKRKKDASKETTKTQFISRAPRGQNKSNFNEGRKICVLKEVQLKEGGRQFPHKCAQPRFEPLSSLVTGDPVDSRPRPHDHRRQISIGWRNSLPSLSWECGGREKRAGRGFRGRVVTGVDQKTGEGWVRHTDDTACTRIHFFRYHIIILSTTPPPQHPSLTPPAPNLATTSRPNRTDHLPELERLYVKERKLLLPSEAQLISLLARGLGVKGKRKHLRYVRNVCSAFVFE